MYRIILDAGENLTGKQTNFDLRWSQDMAHLSCLGAAEG